jgi:hypothetical protein
MPVHLKDISLKNFKSVSCGTFSLDAVHLQLVTGLCAKHNAVLEALALCKSLMSGQRLPPKTSSLIRSEATQLECTLRFCVDTAEIAYTFTLCCYGQQATVHTEHITIRLSAHDIPPQVITCTSGACPTSAGKKQVCSRSALFFPEILPSLPRVVLALERLCKL